MCPGNSGSGDVMGVFANVTQKGRRVVRLAMVCAVMMPAVVAQADTLADALTGAYNHSGLLDQNRALLRAADEDVASAAAALQPVLTWTATARRRYAKSRSSSALFGTTVNRGYNNQVIVRLNASLLLYDGGASAARINAARETVLAARAGLIGFEQLVLLRAVNAYMNLRQAGEIVALRQNNLRLLTQELRAARDRFEVGEITRTDVALAEARLAQARSGLATAEGQRLQAIEEYRNVVGKKPGRLAAPARVPKIDTNLDRAKGVAVRQHPAMLEVQHQVAAAEFDIQASEGAMSPTLTLEGTLGATNNLGTVTTNSDASVGVTAQGTIYQGGRLSSAVRRSMATRDAARAGLHITRHNIQQDVGNALADVSIASASLEASVRQIRAARVAFRGVREEATLGARTTLDVLDAEQELLDAEAARITAQTSQYIAAYTVLASLGQLTAKNLKLPVQEYDAEAYYNLVKDGVAVKSKQGQKLDRVLRALQKD